MTYFVTWNKKGENTILIINIADMNQEKTKQYINMHGDFYY